MNWSDDPEFDAAQQPPLPEPIVTLTDQQVQTLIDEIRATRRLLDRAATAVCILLLFIILMLMTK